MARRPEYMGSNMARTSNPLSQFAPSFPTPAINSLLLDNNELMLLPLAVAPQQISYLLGGTVLQAAYGPEQPPQQIFERGAGRIQPRGVAQPLVDDEAALVAALNNFESRPFQPNGHITGWPLGQLHEQRQVPRYPGPQPFGQNGRGVPGLLIPKPSAPNTHFTQQPQATGAVAPYGNNNAGAPAPLVGSDRYGSPSWAPRPTGPAYLAGSGSGSGSGRSARTAGLASKPTKSFEEFLWEQGIPVPIVDDDTDDECDCHALVAELLRCPAEEPGRMENAGLQTSAAGRNWLLPPAVGFRSGPSHDQLGLGTTVCIPMPSFGACAVGGRSSYGRAVAAAAREERRKKVAEKKVATAKARAQKLAAARESPEGT